MNKDRKNIYLVECGKQFYKIGVATDMTKRLVGLSVGNPFPLYIVTKNKVDNAQELERIFHKKLKHKRINGEWFELAPPEVLEVCTIIHSKEKRKKFSYKKTQLLSDKRMKIYETKKKEWSEKRENLLLGKREVSKNVKTAKPIIDIPLVAEAIALIKLHNRASVSFLQTKLKIGYARAARIMDILEKQNIVGSYNGSKPRKILISI